MWAWPAIDVAEGVIFSIKLQRPHCKDFIGIDWAEAKGLTKTKPSAVATICLNKPCTKLSFQKGYLRLIGFNHLVGAALVNTSIGSQ